MSETRPDSFIMYKEAYICNIEENLLTRGYNHFKMERNT